MSRCLDAAGLIVMMATTMAVTPFFSSIGAISRSAATAFVICSERGIPPSSLPVKVTS